MTEEVKRWLETKFDALEAKIDNTISRMLDITAPIKEDVAHLRHDIDALYDRARMNEGRIGVLEAKADVKDQSKQFNTTTIVAVAGAVIMAAIAIIGFFV